MSAREFQLLLSFAINFNCLKRFISRTINNFLNDSSQDDNIIPNFLFEERKRVFIKLPFCGKNEKLAKTFIAKLNNFTNFNFIFVTLWQTKQIKNLFNNNDKKTLADLKLFTKEIVVVAMTTLARLEKFSSTNCGSFKSYSHLRTCKTLTGPSITFFHLACSILSPNIPQAKDRRGANDTTTPPQFEQTSHILCFQTFPIGNYVLYMCMRRRSLRLTLMMANSRKRLVFTF